MLKNKQLLLLKVGYFLIIRAKKNQSNPIGHDRYMVINLYITVINEKLI